MTAVYRTDWGLIYAQTHSHPFDDDPTVAYVDSAHADLAPLIVELLNAHLHYLRCGCSTPPDATDHASDLPVPQHGGQQ